MYLVNVSVGMCTCPVGNNGALCKHQHAVMQAFNVQGSHSFPVMSSTARKCFYEIATGIVLGLLVHSPDILYTQSLKNEQYCLLHDSVYLLSVKKESSTYQTTGLRVWSLRGRKTLRKLNSMQVSIFQQDIITFKATSGQLIKLNSGPTYSMIYLRHTYVYLLEKCIKHHACINILILTLCILAK